MNYPRVLIINQPFNSHTGGGITLTNLFQGWPKEKLGVAATGHLLYNVGTDICSTYYQLGSEEYRWAFPFGLLQRSFASGLLSFVNRQELPVHHNQAGLRFFAVNRLLYPFLQWIGLFHCLSKIALSDRFKAWLLSFHPDILYLQVSTRETIDFATRLMEFLNIPAVLHMMDDWPSTISTRGLFKNYWRKKIQVELSQLVSKVGAHLSISEAMAAEYTKRYEKLFIPFHNPIETALWLPYSKVHFSINEQSIVILHAGRLGVGVSDSLVEVASAIDELANEGFHAKLHIQTPIIEHKVLDRLRRHKCVVVDSFAEYVQLPKILSQADLLLIANDFTENGLAFLRYSMPTKVPEYMISGTPVVVYAPHETAVAKFFKQNECGYCIESQSSESIKKGIRLLLGNEDYRMRISRNAVQLARARFDASIVRDGFQKLLFNVLERG